MNETIGRSLLQLVHRHSKRLRVPAALAICFVGYVLSIGTTGQAWLYWTTLACTVYLLRPVVMKKIEGAKETDIRAKLVATGLYSALGGSTMSSCVLLFPQLDLSERSIVTLILAGFGAGGSVTNAGYPPLFLCFIVPLLLPLGVVWMIDPGGHLGPTVAFSIGFLIVMMIGVLTVPGRDTFRTFSAYVEVSEKQSRLSAELSAALEFAEQQRRRAETSDRSKTRFLAAASHDLRQPVHVVSLLGAALQAVEKDGRKAQIVRDLNVAIGSLSEQLNALLDLSRLDSGAVVPRFAAIDLQRVVESVIDEFRGESSAKDVALVNAIDRPLHVWSDAGMLCQILRNVLGNALKYTAEGTVTVAAVEDEGHATLSCRDTGPGMSAEERQHVFEEFYRADNPERDQTPGLGLGLSIVDRLARSLSHDLRLESEVEAGTCVSLRMERAAPSSPTRRESSGRAENVDAEVSFQGWVHVVDDELPARSSMELLLGELGCRTSSSGSTEETMRFLEKNRPDVVLIDLRLRGEDSGLLVLEAAKRLDPRIHLAIVTAETFERSSDLGSIDDVPVLRKPVGRAELVALLNSFPVHERHPVPTAGASEST